MPKVNGGGVVSAHTPRNRHLSWVLVYALAVTVLLIFGTLWYVSFEIGKNNSKWCELMVTLDSPIPAQAGNPRAVDAAIKFHKLRISLGC